MENICDNQANDSQVGKDQASNKAEKHARYCDRTDPTKDEASPFPEPYAITLPIQRSKTAWRRPS
jgi:hypothetical protein